MYAVTLGEALARQKRAERSGFALIFGSFASRQKNKTKNGRSWQIETWHRYYDAQPKRRYRQMEMSVNIAT